MALAIVCIPKFYITGDGASHSYNAKVFYDYLLGNDRDFYKPFYQINRNIEPNLLSQFILGAIQKILPYWLSEKIFQCCYIILFAFGFRYLLKQINGTSHSLSLLFFPLCFTLPFQMGFYNFSLAITLLFFTIGFALKNSQQNDVQTNFSILVLLLLTCLCHGMVASLGILLIALIIFFQKNNIQTKLVQFINICTPSLIIVLGFLLRQGIDATPHSLSKLQKLENLCRLYANISTRNLEQFPITLLAIFIVVFFIYSLIKFTKNKLNYVFGIFLAYLLISYINAPATLAYAGGTDIRLASVIPIFIICFIQIQNFSKNINLGIIVFAMLLQFTLIFIRLPHIILASIETKSILKTNETIKPNSTVLKIQLNEHGSKNQFEIDNSFLHITDYLGTTKPLILLNNFEAEINYFSVLWRPNMNPRIYMPNISNNKIDSFGQIKNYEKATHQKINYIIWIDDVRQNFLVKGKVQNNDIQKSILLDSINQKYTCIDSNTSIGLKLFENKY